MKPPPPFTLTDTIPAAGAIGIVFSDRVLTITAVDLPTLGWTLLGSSALGCRQGKTHYKG